MNHLILEDESGDLQGYSTLPFFGVRRDMLGVMTDWIACILAAY